MTDNHSSTESASQYAAACNAAALFDISNRTTVTLRGKDRAAFLHNFCTSDIKKLAPGTGCESFLTNIKGRILGHLNVSAEEDTLWIDSEPGSGEAIAAHLDKYVIMEDVEIADCSAGYSPLLLVGPQAEAWLREQCDSFTPPPLWGQVSTSLNKTRVMIRRVGFTQPEAFMVIVTTADAASIRQGILDAGVTPASADVLEVLRIEAGYPRYGVDITEENIAQEAGRTAQAISFTKGCYLGQEPIARLDALGHTNKELHRVRLSAGPLPAPGSPIHSTSDEPAGQITSAALSPSTGCPVALAMLKSAFTKPGTELKVNGSSASVL